MEIKYDVAIEGQKRVGRGRPLSNEVIKILEFIDSNHSNMVFEYGSTEECKKRRSCVDVAIKRKSYPLWCKTDGNKLYVIRNNEGSGAKS